MTQIDDKFEGGLETLGPLDEATDVHEAVGRFWARAILQHNFDNGADDEPGGIEA